MISTDQPETVMAQVVVRNLDEAVKTRIKQRAARHGRSMEEEVRVILGNAVREDALPAAPLGSRIASRFRGQGLDAPLPEFSGESPMPLDFGA
jgi:plasmid stability protein